MRLRDLPADYPAMRYRDASHVDTGSFYARRPQLGRVYRLLGYAAVVWVWCCRDDAELLARLMIGLLILWLMAWCRVVGTLWRSSIVAALVLCATMLTAHHFAACRAQACVVRAEPSTP